MPNNETLLAARSLCKYELGDEIGANRDWERLRIIVARNGSVKESINLADGFIAMRGYNEMVKSINNYRDF